MMKSLSIISLCVLICFSANAEIKVWCVGDCEKIGPTGPSQEQNLFWDGKENVVSLRGAKNEYVAFQIIINPSKGDVSGLNVIADDFKNGNSLISRTNIDLFKEHYMDVTVTSRGDPNHIAEDAKVGEFSTQMIPSYAPKGGFPFDVKNNRNQPVWVDVYIPEDAKAGNYESVFTVSINGKDLVKIKAKLTVWNFALPNETHFRSYLYYGPEQIKWAYRYKDYGEKFQELEGKFLKMAHQHRLGVCPNIELIDSNFDFDGYWKRYGKYIDGSGYTERFGKNTAVNTWMVGIDNDNDSAFGAAAKALVNYFGSKNLSNILMLYVWDEPRASVYDIIRKRCKIVHETVGKKLPCMVTVRVKSELEGYVDVWNSGGISLADAKMATSRGEKVWTYNGGWGCGPYVDTPGIAGRTQGWIGWKFNLDGWEFWDSTYWIDKHNIRKIASHAVIDADPEKYMIDLYKNPLNFDEMRKPGYPERDSIRINGDGIVFYPGYDVGIDEPVSSFVMKSLRRGMQDYEYLWLLDKAGKGSETKAIVDTIIPDVRRWDKTPNDWYSARIKLGEMLDKK